MSVIQFTASPERPTTCRIKIALAVDDNGNWAAHGGSEYQENYSIDELLEDELSNLDGDAKQQYWLVVDIPLPPSEVVAGKTDDER